MSNGCSGIQCQIRVAFLFVFSISRNYIIHFNEVYISDLAMFGFLIYLIQCLDIYHTLD